MKRYSITPSTLAAFCCATLCGAALSQEPQYSPPIDANSVVLIETEATQSVAQLDAATSDETQVAAPIRYDVELLFFGYDRRGACAACDVARPVVRREAEYYPIQEIYHDRVDGARIAREWNVREYPTFVLIRTNAGGEAIELQRWSGCYAVQERIESAFRTARYARPPKPLPPRRHPIPPKPFPPRVEPPRVQPPRTRQEPSRRPQPRPVPSRRPWWSFFWD